MKRIFTGIMLFIGVMLTACEQETTPFPVEIPPTATPIPIESPLPPIRYGIIASAQPIAINLESNMQITLITDVIDPATLGTEYDVLVTWGELDGWQQSPRPLNISLGINPNAIEIPFQQLIMSAIDPQTLVESIGINGSMVLSSQELGKAQIRTELANAGRPDGFSLEIGAMAVPGISLMSEHLNSVNFEHRFVEITASDTPQIVTEQELEAVLFMWSDDNLLQEWNIALGEENIVHLFSLPVSYLTSTNTIVTFNQLGFPLVSR